jgi:hypothetical protein
MTLLIANRSNRAFFSGLLMFSLLGCTPAPSISATPEPPVAEDLAAAESPTGEAIPLEGSAISPASPPASPQATAKDEFSDITETDLPQSEAEVTNLLAIAGIEEAQAVKDFLAEMRAGAIAGDREAIVSLVHYPFTTYLEGQAINTYQTPAELLADYDQVVSPAVIEAMSVAEYADLFVTSDGAMIGNGEVWFGQFEDGIKIRAINSF